VDALLGFSMDVHCCRFVTLLLPPVFFSPINILFQLDCVSPLFSHLILCSCNPFAFSFFSPVLLFSCSFSDTLLVLAVAYPSFKFSCLPNGAVEIFILQAYCAISLSVGCPSFWDCVVAPSSGVGWIHGVYAAECPINTHPLHFIDPPVLSLFIGHLTLEEEATECWAASIQWQRNISKGQRCWIFHWVAHHIFYY